MTFELPELPYAIDALAPYISQQTLEFHHGKHHRAYVDNLNRMVAGTEHEGRSLEEVIKAAEGGVFNNAAQVWNHTFYWNSMAPGGGGAPEGAVGDALSSAFGSYDAFREQFTEAAMTQFGSGWAWLVHDGSQLSIQKTANADLPLAHDTKAVLTVDVWEHAYYLDYQNRRPDYLNAFLDHLVNWAHVESQLP